MRYDERHRNDCHERYWNAEPTDSPPHRVRMVSLWQQPSAEDKGKENVCSCEYRRVKESLDQPTPYSLSKEHRIERALDEDEDGEDRVPQCLGRVGRVLRRA